MAVTVKVQGGDWGECVAGFGPGWSGEHRIILPRPDGGFWGRSDTYVLTEAVADVEVLTEENKSRVAAALGWGAAGGLLLGPVGALAGLVLGGRGKRVTFVCHFTDGKRILATTDDKSFAHFQVAAAKRAVSRLKGITHEPDTAPSAPSVEDEMEALDRLIRDRRERGYDL